MIRAPTLAVEGWKHIKKIRKLLKFNKQAVLELALTESKYF